MMTKIRMVDRDFLFLKSTVEEMIEPLEVGEVKFESGSEDERPWNDIYWNLIGLRMAIERFLESSHQNSKKFELAEYSEEFENSESSASGEKSIAPKGEPSEKPDSSQPANTTDSA